MREQETGKAHAHAGGWCVVELEAVLVFVVVVVVLGLLEYNIK